jgi:hypothetical protein
MLAELLVADPSSFHPQSLALLDDTLATCVVRKTAGWRFRRVSAAAPTTVRVPLVFRYPGAGEYRPERGTVPSRGDDAPLLLEPSAL